MKEQIRAVLKDYWGYDRFRELQEDIILSVLERKDTLALLPTGGGKSICFQVPGLVKEGICIVISPLIALMKDQVENLKKRGINAGAIYSGLSTREIESMLSNCVYGDSVKFLYVSPERLKTPLFINHLQQMNVSLLAVDEAHCISQWGYDFRPPYLEISKIREYLPDVPVLALTATATPEVVVDIQEKLGFPELNTFQKSFKRDNLTYMVVKEQNKMGRMIRVINHYPGTGIVYVRNRRKTKEIAEYIAAHNITADFYHAGLSAEVRDAKQNDWMNDKTRVIVSTNAFGMGIDKPDVRFVIHYDIPKSLEGYYQETGRAGRDGGEGNCIAYYSYSDIVKLEKFMQGKPIAEQEIGKQLLLETVSYAESSVCRRKILLHYFGEEYPNENCEACDNCLHPKAQFEGSESVVNVLETILAVKEKFKADHIANILSGKMTAAIKSYRHHKLEFFGAGEDKDDKYWNMVIRQALIAKLLTKDIENYGILKVTEKGMEFIDKPSSFMLAEDHDYAESSDEENAFGARTAAVDDELFSILKDLRKKISKQKNVPPFVIFQDPSLEDMAIQYPINLDELLNISGVGAGKAQRYGTEFVNIIKKYVEEKEIIRPLDMVVRSVVNKSGLKVYIIQSIDMKRPLEDIAETKGLEMEELLSEIEAIVNAGTRINLDYYINMCIDDERQHDIY